MIRHEFEFRIAYADTDRMGVVYYANYYVLFERGRTELMRELGLRYRDMEEKEKIFLPAMTSSCEYLAPARYDDLIRIRTVISKVGGAHVTFKYEIINTENEQILARGETKHPLVDERWKPVRIPAPLRKLLKKAQGE